MCAETWDGYLNDINGAHVRPEHAVAALDAAVPGRVAEGSVGGGTGMNCYDFKGGNGTASRSSATARTTYTVGGVRAGQLRFRRELTVRGVPVGPRWPPTIRWTDWLPPISACGRRRAPGR